MKKHLRYIDENSDKFWNIEVSGAEFKVTYGKNGTAGTSQSKKFDTDELALKAADKLLAEKIKKGYSEDGTPASPKAKAAPGSKKADQENLAAGYDAIVKSRLTSALLPFLKANAKGNVEILKKQLKKNRKYWLEFTDLSQEPQYASRSEYGRWGIRGDETQRQILLHTAIALYNKSDIASWDEVLSVLDKPEKPLTLEVLQWAKPSWLEDFILGQLRKQDWVRFSYKSLRFLEDQGLIGFTPELYARCIALATEWGKKMKEREYIAWVMANKIAYERDVPLLFEYETPLHNQGFRDNITQDYNEFSAWGIIFETLLKEGKMERSFFIEQSILIQTKDWNAALRSFFRKRLADVNPTAEELLPHQESIFAGLYNALPAIPTFAVEQVKKMYDKPEFAAGSFLEWAEPLMMRSDAKAAVKNLISILEKLNKLHPKRNKAITSLLADVFVIPDLPLQERAAKLLVKIASAKDTTLADKLEGYAPLMHGGVRSMLDKLIGFAHPAGEGEAETYQYNPARENVLTEEVALPKDWNDILYLFGQFIASDDVLDAEMLLNAFIMQRHLFPADYSKQLEPYSKQLENYFSSTYKGYVSLFLRQKIHSLIRPLAIANDRHNKIKTLLLIRPVLYEADQRTRAKTPLPMLSMPTHKPHWVAPIALVERLIARQEAGEKSDPLDLAIAISRMPRENTEEALPLLDKLEGEMKSLMAFCLGASDAISIPKTGFINKLLSALGTPENLHKTGIWAVAARTYHPDGEFPEFKNDFGDFAFAGRPFRPVIIFKELWMDVKNWQTGKMERTPSWYELHFEPPGYKAAPPYLIYSQDLDGSKRGNYQFLLQSAGNVMYWNSLLPQNNEPLALHLIQTALSKSSGAGGEVEGFLNIINLPGFRFSGTELLAFACSFFQEKKELRLLAAEVLINLIDKQKVDIAPFSQKLAWLAANKYGSFQRLADSLAMLKDVSPMHNSALLQVIEAILENFTEDKLPINFKKLIETYLDVLYKANAQPAAGAVAFLEQWKENGTLKPMIKQILN